MDRQAFKIGDKVIPRKILDIPDAVERVVSRGGMEIVRVCEPSTAQNVQFDSEPELIPGEMVYIVGDGPKDSDPRPFSARDLVKIK
jgi:hypothetical protein